MSECRSCHAPVVWVETEATETKPGKKMPLDADPDKPTFARYAANGNLRYTGKRTGDGTPIVRYVAAGTGAHVSHFATCPESSSWRRSR